MCPSITKNNFSIFLSHLYSALVYNKWTCTGWGRAWAGKGFIAALCYLLSLLRARGKICSVFYPVLGIPNEANVCQPLQLPHFTGRGVGSCSIWESLQHKGGIKPFLHPHPFGRGTFCATPLTKHSSESSDVNGWLGSSGVWLFSLPSRGTSVLLCMGLLPINELIRCSLSWWLVFELPARCVGEFLFLFCFWWRDMKVILQVTDLKKKILFFGIETYFFIAHLLSAPPSARSDGNSRHWTAASVAGVVVPSWL